MTSQEFVTWFKGFVSAANTFNITPKQWDIICEHLEKVQEEQYLKSNKYILDLEGTNWNTTTITSNNRNDISYKKDNLETKTQLND